MKNLYPFAIGLLLVSVVFMGCGKTSTSPQNYMKYNNKEYDLSQGIILNGDSLIQSAEAAAFGHPYVLLLMSKGLVAHGDNGVVDSISGKGSAIMFMLFANSANGIDDGSYLFDSLSFAKPGTVSYANAVFDYDVSTATGLEVEVSSGTLTVKKSGDNYTFNFDCTANTGKGLTGHYEGVVKMVNGNLGAATVENPSGRVFKWDFKHTHPGQ